MTDASSAQRRVLFLAARLAQRSDEAATSKKDKGATHLVVRRGSDRIEPSQKRLFRSDEKVFLGDGPEALLDVARGGIECPSMRSVYNVLQELLYEGANGTLVLLRIKMRFDEKSDGGWRDALVNFRFEDDTTEHVCELQIMHKKMMTIRADMGAHHDYAQFRGAVELLEKHGVDWQKRITAMEGDLADVDKGGSEREKMQAKKIKELQDDIAYKKLHIAELEMQNRMFKEMARDQRDGGATKKEQDQVLSQFQAWDKDGNGKISKDEFRDVMLKIKSPLRAADIDKVFQKVDKDGNGNIDFNEFVGWMFDART